MKSKNKLTYEYVKSYIEGFGYKLLSKEYINATSKMVVECPYGHKYEVNWNKFQMGRRCPICHYDKVAKARRLSYDEVKEFVEKQGYTLLSKTYVKAKDKLTFMCPEGHIFEMTFCNFKTGNRCPQCYLLSKKEDYRIIESYVLKFGYKLISREYVDKRCILELECPEGHVFKMRSDQFKEGKRCPICKKSKGETKVANVLDILSVEYERQYVFEDCRDKLPLPFDFYIEKYCLIIEYDGQQHFEPVDFAGKGEEWSIQNMKETQRRDAIKNQYCEDNNINILRIPYWEFDDIEKLIKDKLNSLK